EKYGKPIGTGAQCQVYRKDNTVYKVLSEGHELIGALHEGFALATAESLDIPVSNIHGVYTECGHIVMEMDYVSGDTLTELIIKAGEAGDVAAIDAYLDEFVALQVKLHSHPAGGLGNVRNTYATLIKTFPGVSDTLREKLQKLLETLPDGDALCHNDFHPLNVIASNNQYVIIDWDSAMIGNAAGDVAHTYLVCILMDAAIEHVYADFSGKYLQKYLAATNMDRASVEAWLPLHAAFLYVSLRQNPTGDISLLEPFFATI
ncbi:MAG: aminoglycoside phosphotransferase family protein, partial [Clostridia bacterium]|nr:aminoglycoside phosphotransferase family protein [Clostridia bacterium]